MFKLVAIAAFLAVASAAPAPGLLGAPLAAPWGAPALASPWGAPAVAPWAAPAVAPWGAPWGAPVVKAALPVATSYANTYKVATPALVAAPALHAPYVAHGPVVSPYAHAW